MKGELCSLFLGAVCGAMAQAIGAQAARRLVMQASADDLFWKRLECAAEMTPTMVDMVDSTLRGPDGHH